MPVEFRLNPQTFHVMLNVGLLVDNPPAIRSPLKTRHLKLEKEPP